MCSLSLSRKKNIPWVELELAVSSSAQDRIGKAPEGQPCCNASQSAVHPQLGMTGITLLLADHRSSLPLYPTMNCVQGSTNVGSVHQLDKNSTHQTQEKLS
jgi:hypothetical protein